VSGAHQLPASDHPVTDDCRYCWMCRHVCPVGHVTHRETYTPHAWAMLIASVERGTLEWTPEAVDVLYACADCGACESHCKTSRPLPDAIVEARASLVAKNAAPPAVQALVAQLTQWHNAFAEKAPETTKSRGDVALFVGDAAWHLAPGSVHAAVRLLEAAGVAVVPVGAGRSSGVLASSLGARNVAVAQARAVLDEIAATGATSVLTLAAEDAYAFTRLYGERLAVTWPEGLERRRAAEVLAEAAAAGTLRFTGDRPAEAYVWLESPQAARAGLDATAENSLLERALGRPSAGALFWHGERAHPAGTIGGLDVTRPDVAAKLSDARLADAARAGAAWLVTDDAAAARHMTQRPAGSVTVQNLYELLATRLA
jgi:Fe-S oxidoreductase